MRHSAPVVLQSFPTEGEADIAKGLLESAGISAVIQADTAGGMRPHLAWSGLGFRLLVREEDAEAARDLLSSPQDDKFSPQDGKFVLVHTFPTQAEADTAQGALLSAGIDAAIEDDSATGWRPEVPWSGTGFRVLVPKEDVVKARDVLQEFI